jgi:hypothetical protein
LKGVGATGGVVPYRTTVTATAGLLKSLKRLAVTESEPEETIAEAPAPDVATALATLALLVTVKGSVAVAGLTFWRLVVTVTSTVLMAWLSGSALLMSAAGIITT